MVDDLSHVTNMRFQVSRDRRQVIHRVLGQSARTLKSAKGEFVENHSPKEQRLEFLQLGDAAPQSE